MDRSAERDEDLMAGVAGGESRLLEPLVRRHAGALLTFLRRLLGDAHASEELFQEVFLAVWVKRQQYDYPRPFKPWLYAIALNKCRAAFRGRRPPPQALDDAPAADASPADSAIASETAELVSRAVARLPQQQRVVVALRVWQGLPYARIAEVVGCTEATVRSHMHHGLAALRESLGPALGAADARVRPGGRGE